jgi:hypothetical protein
LRAVPEVIVNAQRSPDVDAGLDGKVIFICVRSGATRKEIYKDRISGRIKEAA